MHWLLCRNGRGMSGIALSPRDADLLASPLSEYIVFRPPSLQSPIPGASMRSAAANIGKMAAQGRDAGEIIEFEVMARPSRRWRRRARKPGTGSARN
jgi:hypothetical protein